MSWRTPGFAWPAGVAGNLIRYAAQATPRELSARLEEEWLADLEAQSSSLARLSFALGCCWASCVITHEHYGASVLTASLNAGRTLVFAVQAVLPRHSRTFVFVLFAHVGLLHVFTSYLTFGGHRPAVPVSVTFHIDAAHSALPLAVTVDTANPGHGPK